MKVAPVIHAASPVSYDSPVEFTFTDDPDWRNAITSITSTINLNSTVKNYISNFQKTVGKMVYMNGSYLVYGTHVWTIKASGYEDVTVTVVVK
ncbi:hemoblobin-interacting domain-containing protein [Lysinibacillus sp. 54212]|uniref:hemoblobin-interacting domain-containing protein n=1 Tax=Lysinibacillus sp. 54212 TaxID=3119829 RepID=UPI002FCB2934